ncbi:hypothetical protein POM88_035649 [Heracleum sosnowskyi]|uniref:Uncharacterized protein n=1 Tax=Heracleum sosnowskyi TaxID=360622 RepID=A0AAD8ME46_9APIA|nr:hypothetical protein POM88_035649 [Heracleum sosnowskyi]
MGQKDYGVKIPVLDKENYFQWKVNMHLHLMSMDEGYVECIDHDPHVPMKPNTSMAQGPARAPSTIPKGLPKEWTPMTISLRNTQEYKDFTLERLYGTLKTYELEMEQDEEIEKVQKKIGSVALVASVNKADDMKEETAEATPSRSACEGRTESRKCKGKMIEENGNDSEEDIEFVNLALTVDSSEQEASSSSNQVITTNRFEIYTEECNGAINDMSTELYHIRISLKSLTKENTRIKDANQFLSDMNVVLETQFIKFEKMRLECQVAKDDLLTVLKREEILKAQLAKEQETIATWIDSRSVATNIIKAQGVDTFYKESIGKDKEKLDVENLGDDSDSDHPLIGHLSNKQLKGKLENIEVKAEAKRKRTEMCGSVNHLSTNCKTVKNSSVEMPMHVPNMPMPLMHNMFAHTDHASNLYANMPLVSNPYMNAFTMPQMT